MNWSSRRVLLVVSSAAAGVIVAGTLTAVAYAGSPSRSGDALYGCVSVRSGALRVVDPQRSRPCSTRGPFREYAITLNQAAGLPGPRGPRGPAGDGIDSLDALEGLPCNVGTEDEGEVIIVIASPEQGSGMRMICETDSTMLTPAPVQAPPTTEPPEPVVEPTRPPVMTTRPPIDEGTPDPTTAPTITTTEAPEDQRTLPAA